MIEVVALEALTANAVFALSDSLLLCCLRYVRLWALRAPETQVILQEQEQRP